MLLELKTDSLHFPLWDLLGSYLVTILIVWIVFDCLRTRYASPLSNIPGPGVASFSRLWQVMVCASGKAEEYYMNIHKKYGPVARTGPNEISFASPAAASTLFKTGQGFHKTDFYTVFLPNGLRDIFTETREDVHALKKRYIGSAYSLAAVQQHTTQMESLLETFMQNLDAYADSSHRTVCDLGSWLHYLAFDGLGEFAFTKRFGFVDAGRDIDGIIATISKSTYDSGVVAQMPFLEGWTRTNPLWKFLPASKSKLALVQDTAIGVLKEYQAGEQSKNASCLLEALYRAHQSSPEVFTLDDVLAISMGAIAAGSDSTASTMHTACWHILSNPDVLEALTKELLEAPLSEIVQYQEAITHLPYLQACLKEAMRLQPAFAFNISRLVPKGGAELDGVYLPAGTRVAVNSWVVHRDKEVFGADADVFNPRRWLNNSEERVKLMERFILRFGGGSHICIGRHLAMFEINKILPQLFRRYKMSLVNPGKPLAHRTGLFFIQDGLHVYLERR